jgi:hypothetical protein
MRFKDEALTLYPYSSQTDEPRTNKIDMNYFSQNLTLSAKLGYDWFTGAGVAKLLLHVAFGCFPLNFIFLLSLVGLQTYCLDVPLASDHNQNLHGL